MGLVDIYEDIDNYAKLPIRCISVSLYKEPLESNIKNV